MDDLGFLENLTTETATPATMPEMFLGTVASANSSGVEITLDGESEPMTKRYKCLRTGRALSANARVMVVKFSGTYVVLGEIAATPS